MRYFVLRGFKHKGQLIEAGSLLTDEVVQKIFPGRERFAIRRLFIIDTEFEYDVSHRERSMQIKRLRLLSEIPSEESLVIQRAIKDILTEKIGSERAAALVAKGLRDIRQEEKAKAEAEAKAIEEDPIADEIAAAIDESESDSGETTPEAEEKPKKTTKKKASKKKASKKKEAE